MEMNLYEFHKTIWHFTLTVKKGEQILKLEYHEKYLNLFRILEYFAKDKNFEITSIYGEIDDLQFLNRII